MRLNTKIMPNLNVVSSYEKTIYDQIPTKYYHSYTQSLHTIVKVNNSQSIVNK